ncbi:hypothetical protein Cyast_0305 [Cyanobacterium stanieri PCC 7202]|uniref:DarT domain-containing protein n=1 Tax=Cyanobacterium stanieri (strain ATCC 29140 / PCC 7202) TaxID=292563 RepID=K9YIR0_CYASC|nr:hypothetical protein Cyast_0305 [Cyanobacterium stanieri PCC 7202]
MKGGQRKGAGNPSWVNRPTKVIRIPHVYSDFLLKLSRMLDNGEDYEEIHKYVESYYKNNIFDYDLTFNSINTDITINNFFEQMAKRKVGIDGLYYITDINNIPSILRNGILSHSKINQLGIKPVTVYDQDIVELRKNKKVNDKPLWDFANLYFQPRNAMLYRLIRSVNSENICILQIKKTFLTLKKFQSKIYISDGNMASSESKAFPLQESENLFNEILQNIDSDWWDRNDGSLRKMMAECLVYDSIPPSQIQSIYVSSDNNRKSLIKKLNAENISLSKISVVAEPHKFFKPNSVDSIHDDGNGTRIQLVKGDLFFSHAQTLTISVNCVGVMGKGLASTAKDRFPDVYVKYQQVCRDKKLSYNRPFLYKRESSVADSLIDSFSGVKDLNDSQQTWFLLFPTKYHWRNNSSLDGIEKGLIWLLNNYKLEGITSIAMPSLGCGQGNLQWRDVGKLMCKYFVQMKGLTTSIYLPNKNIDPIYLTSDYLLPF